MIPDSDDPLTRAGWHGTVQPSAQVSRLIRRECTRGLGRSHRLSTTTRVALSIGLLIVVALILYWLSSGLPSPSGTARAALLGTAGWGLMNAAVLFIGLARPPGRRGPCVMRWMIAASLPVLFLIYLVLTASSRLPIVQFATGSTASHALSCGLIALTVGAVVSAGVMLLWRRTDPFNPGLSGALVGLFGGIGSAATVGVLCPSHEACHMCFSHGFVVVALVVAGGLIGHRLLAP